MSQFPIGPGGDPSNPDAPSQTGMGGHGTSFFLNPGQTARQTPFVYTIPDHKLNEVMHRVMPGVANFTKASIQVTNKLGVTWSTGVITVRQSVTGRPEDAIDFTSAVTLSATGVLTAISDISGAVFLHFVTTAVEAGSGEVQIHIHLSVDQA